MTCVDFAGFCRHKDIRIDIRLSAQIIQTPFQGELLKEYNLHQTQIEERAVAVAEYIIENNATVRQAAGRFGISKSTVHVDVTMQNGRRFHGVMTWMNGEIDIAPETMYADSYPYTYGNVSVAVGQEEIMLNTDLTALSGGNLGVFFA